MEIILNKIAIWKADFHQGYTVRTVPVGTKYIDNKTNLYCVSDKLMYRYAKNYTRNDIDFCLFARSFRNDKDGIEEELDEVAKGLTESKIRKAVVGVSTTDFVYLDKYLEEGEN